MGTMIDTTGEISTIREAAVQGQLDRSILGSFSHASEVKVDVHIDVDIAVDVGVVDVTGDSSDIWSAAYREAVNSLGEDINRAIFKGENVAELFKQLGEMDKESAQDSAFVRGVKYLHSLQVPLENIKLALDLAAPLASIEPTAGTVFGVVRGVTAVSLFTFNFISAKFHLQNKRYLIQQYHSYHGIKITNPRRLPSVCRPRTWPSQNRLVRCWSKSPTLTLVTRLARNQTHQTFSK